MNTVLFRKTKRYRRQLAKRFTKEIPRRQFNIMCDKKIVLAAKSLARSLGVPVFCAVEHGLQLGLGELMVLAEDKTTKEALQRHLVEFHLLVTQPEPMDQVTSKRLTRIKNVMNLLKLLEIWGGPEKQRELILRFFGELRRKGR